VQWLLRVVRTGWVALGLAGTKHAPSHRRLIGHGIENGYLATLARPWASSVEQTAEIYGDERSAAGVNCSYAGRS
jgi:hypothetical protein